MSIDPNALLPAVLEAARSSGLDQRALARAAGVSPETISRAKKRSTMDLETLAALAGAAGLRLTLESAARSLQMLPPPAAARSSLADPKWGLAWSNPAMSAAALIRNALLKGSFATVLEAVLAHGMACVRREWKTLRAADDLGLTARSRTLVDRTLANIEEGLRRAEA